MARCPAACVAVPHNRQLRLGVNEPFSQNPFTLVSRALISLTHISPASIYDVVVYSSCRRASSALLAVTTISVIASVVVKHGSILTAGIVGMYAAQLVWSALQESDCTAAAASAAELGHFHQDSISAAVASLLVRLLFVTVVQTESRHLPPRALQIRSACKQQRQTFFSLGGEACAPSRLQTCESLYRS